MEFVAVLIVCALVFGVCFLVDKGFQKLFRSKAQHKSGLSVRLSKRYGSIGLIVGVVGIAAIVASFGQESWLLGIAGGVLLLVGCALVVYYMTFGVYYDNDSFILTTFGKRSITYRYADILGQQLYAVAGAIVIEVYLSDGRTFQLQSGMSGAYDFMDKAFSRWLEQTGRRQEDCDFYNPQNSCWFPNVEEK